MLRKILKNTPLISKWLGAGLLVIAAAILVVISIPKQNPCSYFLVRGIVTEDPTVDYRCRDTLYEGTKCYAVPKIEFSYEVNGAIFHTTILDPIEDMTAKQNRRIYQKGDPVSVYYRGYSPQQATLNKPKNFDKCRR